MGAEKQERKIAVEIKSFVGSSDVDDLEAIGQCVLYQEVLKLREPERQVFLAIRESVYYELFAGFSVVG